MPAVMLLADWVPSAVLEAGWSRSRCQHGQVLVRTLPGCRLLTSHCILTGSPSLPAEGRTDLRGMKEADARQLERSEAPCGGKGRERQGTLGCWGLLARREVEAVGVEAGGSRESSMAGM